MNDSSAYSTPLPEILIDLLIHFNDRVTEIMRIIKKLNKRSGKVIGNLLFTMLQCHGEVIGFSEIHFLKIRFK